MTESVCYDGVIERWKINLALSRIRAFGFPQREWPDLLQRLSLPIAQFKYDPSRGAKESTALYALVNNQLRTVRRAARCEMKHLEHYSAGVKSEYRDNHTEMRLDVQAAIADLPQQQQAVCAHLLEGRSVRQIAATLHTSERRVQGLIAAVRARFTAIGLDAWARAQ